MQVTQLYLHPVKSLGGISVQQFAVDRFGPTLDRRWLVVKSDGQFITQRQKARMALVRATLEQDQVTLQMEGQGSIRFSPADFTGTPRQVTVWRDQCEALAGPAQLDDWLSSALDMECQLVFMPDSTRRLVDPAFARQAETVSFADGFPLLLTNESSLQFLNDQMSIKVGMERFRPNLVIAGADAFAEDGWKRIRVGSMTFIVAKPCSRCAIPTIDPQTARKQPEVFKTLQDFRQREGEVFFGQNLVPVGTGSIQVGDDVEVLE